MARAGASGTSRFNPAVVETKVIIQDKTWFFQHSLQHFRLPQGFDDLVLLEARPEGEVLEVDPQIKRRNARVPWLQDMTKCINIFSAEAAFIGKKSPKVTQETLKPILSTETWHDFQTFIFPAIPRCFS